MTYEQAVEQAKMNNDDGFRFLYENTYKDKYYIALKYMQNEQDALDVLQDAYLRAFKSLDSLYEADKFSAWMGMIVANTAKNALSSRKRQILFSEMSTTDDDFFEEKLEDDNVENQPELAYTIEETKGLVNEMIQSLSEEQRLCILMFYIENMSIREIAYSLECSENTVKSRLNYGRKNLKAKAAELEKKGYRLHGLAPLPLLVGLIRAELAAFVPSAEAAGLFSLGYVGSAMNAINAAGDMATAGMDSGLATKAGTGAVKKAFLHTIGGKIAVGVAATAVLAGIVAAVMHNSNKDDDKNLKMEVSAEATDSEAVSTEAVETGVATDLDADIDTTEEYQEENEEYKQAYLKVLKENKDNIKRYESWSTNWYNYPENYGEHPVAITDATGDGVPELIILNQKEDYLVDVEIYSFNADKVAEKIFSYQWDVSAGSGQKSFLFKCKNNDSLYLYIRYGDVYNQKTFLELKPDDNGNLQADEILSLYENYEEMYESNVSGTYVSEGNSITKEAFDQEEAALIGSISTVFLYNDIPYDELNMDNVKKEAMTYEAALELLGAGENTQQDIEITDWKSAYIAVLNDPVSWLQDTQQVDAALLNTLFNYEYSLFDINQDGTPELIICANKDDNQILDYFFCTYSKSDGAYLIANKESNFRYVLVTCNNQLAWFYQAPAQPYCSITYMNMTMEKLEDGEGFSYENVESAPEVESLKTYPVDDMSAFN